jgi:hypothetical protein
MSPVGVREASVTYGTLTVRRLISRKLVSKSAARQPLAATVLVSREEPDNDGRSSRRKKEAHSKRLRRLIANVFIVIALAFIIAQALN